VHYLDSKLLGADADDNADKALSGLLASDGHPGPVLSNFDYMYCIVHIGRVQ